MSSIICMNEFNYFLCKRELIYFLLVVNDSSCFFPVRFQPRTTEKCFKNRFQNILLVVVFNFPLYDHIPILYKLYGKVFPNMIFCGTEDSSNFTIIKSNIHKGYFSYACLATAMNNYANYTGYLMLNDDVLLNFWNLADLNIHKIWEGPKKPISVGEFHKPDLWYWWKSRWGLKNCRKALNETRKLLNVSETMLSQRGKRYIRKLFINLQNNSHNESNCFGGRSDVVYIPRTYSPGFMLLSRIFRRHDVFVEIAIPTILRMLERSKNFLNISGIYLPGRVGTEPVTNSEHLWRNYDYENLHFIHPVKLHYGKNSTTNYIVLRYFIQRKVDALVQC